MIGRKYSVSFTAQSLVATNAMDLFEITPADDKPLVLLGLTLDNVGGVADAGDVQEELLSCIIRRGYTASGSGGGTGVAPAPLESSAGVAAGFTCETCNTNVATTGTAVDLWPFGWNVRIPFREFWPEEVSLGVSQANTTLVVRVLTGPADAVTISGCLFVCELG